MSSAVAPGIGEGICLSSVFEPYLSKIAKVSEVMSTAPIGLDELANGWHHMEPSQLCQDRQLFNQLLLRKIGRGLRIKSLPPPELLQQISQELAETFGKYRDNTEVFPGAVIAVYFRATLGKLEIYYYCSQAI